MDPFRVQQAIAAGLAFPCSLCVHHWRAVDANGDSCGKEECGGPVSGRTFPDYRGPLPEGDWGHFCFLSGTAADLMGVKVIGGTRMLAIASDERGIFDECSLVTGAIDCTGPRKVLLISNKAIL